MRLVLVWADPALAHFTREIRPVDEAEMQPLEASQRALHRTLEGVQLLQYRGQSKCGGDPAFIMGTVAGSPMVSNTMKPILGVDIF